MPIRKQKRKEGRKKGRKEEDKQAALIAEKYISLLVQQRQLAASDARK